MKFGRFIGVFAFVLLITSVACLPAGRAQTLTPEQRAALQAQYDQLQVEIAQWQKVLDDTQAKKKTLTGDVTALNAQIKKAQKEIQQRSITITTLGSEITQKTATISSLQQKLAAGQESLAKLLREKNEAEQQPLAILALSSDDLSSFFSDVQNIDAIDAELQDLFATLRGVKTQTEAEKKALNEKKNAELDARHEVVVKQTAIKQDQAQQQQLLNITTKNEQAYQAVLADRQKQATAIRNALFELRDSAGISFESALQYATAAEAATGVRAAFILGILRQESNLGTNVGQCYLADPLTGAGKGKNSGTPIQKVMNPTRDVPPFIDLMQRLGDDPYSQVVSCPQSVGYGGAMGPSQFIASTWKLYEPRINGALGVSVADPWNAQTAIMATALYMKDLGANKATYSAERKAAAGYYAGSNWQTRAALSYADSVLAFADTYQNNIDFLKDN